MNYNYNKNYHGLLLINKDPNCTSYDVVRDIKKIFNISQVGHAGTLDPIASGLMVILMGKATKLNPFVTNLQKEYVIKVKLGISTDTLDRTGDILSQTDYKITDKKSITKIVNSLVGSFNFEVPLYSAIKVRGKRLYQYARNKEKVDLPSKNMIFFHTQLLEICNDQEIRVFLRCSKGSYVRSWVKKLGDVLQSGAIINDIKRIKVGSYKINEAITIKELKKNQVENTKENTKLIYNEESNQKYNEEYQVKEFENEKSRCVSEDRKQINEKSYFDLYNCSSFVPFEKALPDWDFLIIEQREQQLLLNGCISFYLKKKLHDSNIKTDNVKIFSKNKEKLLALIHKNINKLDLKADFKITKVFNY